MYRSAKAVLAASVLAVCLNASANADQVTAGRAAFARGDYGTAARLVVPLAERGNAAAQAMLGFMYETGQGMPQAYEAAAYWYTQSAERGDTTAQYMLGLMYSKGLGVPIDEVAAYKWLNLATSRAPKRFRESYQRIRDAVASKMNSQQIAYGQWLALQWSSRPTFKR